jgi:hypothetical protein
MSFPSETKLDSTTKKDEAVEHALPNQNPNVDPAIGADDDLTREDIIRAAALSTSYEKAEGYLTSTELIGSAAAISLSVLW